jgi:hypothetical protein
MYSGVPMRIVSICPVDISQLLAKPKSQSLRRGGLRLSRMVLSSLRSLRVARHGEGRAVR